MHIPNGFLDPKTSAGAAFAAAAALGYCVARVKQALSAAVPESVLAGIGNAMVSFSERSKKFSSSLAEKHIMKMGAVASLIFAAQMFNFPVANGTSGHLIGGILAAIVLGPFSGTLVIASVLFVQGFFFADGGLAALGANILNMAVVGSLLSYYIYYFIARVIRNRFGFYIGVAFASFSAVLLASVACSIEIAFSGTISLDVVLPAMALVHAKIGLAEALITLATVELLIKMGFEMEGKLEKE